jgi:hypothetical protein
VSEDSTFAAYPWRRGLCSLGVSCWLVIAWGCASLDAKTIFRASERGLLIVEHDGVRTLKHWNGETLEALPIEAPREARFAGSGRLVVVRELPSADEFGLPDTEVLRLDLATGSIVRIGERGQHYDAAPSPDGRLVAINVEGGTLGDSDLEIWSLDDPPETLARRHQSLEEPCWRSDGHALVASLLMGDPLGDEGEGGSFGGTSFSWPRLHRFRRDLGEPALLHDGAEAETLAPGGTLALWWDARGLFARQRAGLVRCDPEARRCVLVFTPGPGRRIVAGAAAGASEALLLTVPTRDAFDRVDPDELLRIDLQAGALVERHRAGEGAAFLEIDAIEAPR